MCLHFFVLRLLYRCNGLGRGEKALFVSKWPKVLTIHFQRQGLYCFSALLICVTVLFLVFPSKVDAKDDKNSQLPKCKIVNHNVYQCDLETLLLAEKINDNVRLKVHSNNIDQQTFFLFCSICQRILHIIVNSNYLEAWLYFNLNIAAHLWKKFLKNIITFLSGYQCILGTSADAQRKQGKIFIRSLIKKGSALIKDSKTSSCF